MLQTTHLRRVSAPGSAALALAIALLGVAAAAGAEALAPVGPSAGSNAPPAPTAEIEPQSLSPAVIRATDDGEFAIANRSTTIARVEFRVPRGERLRCHDGQDILAGRKFVIGNGETLRCAAPSGAVDYWVFRNLRVSGGSFRTLRSEGRVEFETP
jgi:hypothetical protein